MNPLHVTATFVLLSCCIPLPAQQPPVFVENGGQFDQALRYMFTGGGSTIWLTARGIVFDGDASGAAEIAQAVVSQTFLGSNPNTVPVAGEPSARDFPNDLNAERWPAGVKAFSVVDYMNLWPGISVRMRGSDLGIEQEFIVQPGANSDNIAVAYDGADGMTIDEHASLVTATALGRVRQGAPYAYQEINGHRIAVPAAYKLTGPESYGFGVGTYAPEYVLVIGSTLFNLSQSTSALSGPPSIAFFNVAPTSTLPGQASIATFSITGATAASVNDIEANCSGGQCAGTILFYPQSTTDYLLEASGAGGNVNASQSVEVGHYAPNPPPEPAGLEVTWQGACWLAHYPKSLCKGACQGMAFNLNIPSPPQQLPLEATLYLGTTVCAPGEQDNLNDLGTLTGSGGWIFWFTHHPNLKNSSAIWTIGNQSSGCVSYAKAPECQ